MRVRCEVINKRIKDGFFSTKYLVTIRPIEKLKAIAIEEKFGINGYYNVEVGDIITLNFEEEDGLYYVDTDFGFQKN